MTAVLKALDWLNGQLSSVMELDSREALCMEYHACTELNHGKKDSDNKLANWNAIHTLLVANLQGSLTSHTNY